MLRNIHGFMLCVPLFLNDPENCVYLMNGLAEYLRRLIPYTLIPIGFSNPERWKNIGKAFAAEGLMPKAFTLKGFVYREPVLVVRLLM